MCFNPTILYITFHFLSVKTKPKFDKMCVYVGELRMSLAVAQIFEKPRP